MIKEFLLVKIIKNYDKILDKLDDSLFNGYEKITSNIFVIYDFAMFFILS